jgi:hypothetical protein
MYEDPAYIRICQGDIYSNIAISGELEVIFDFCVVLTQDCDLQQDYDAVARLEDYGKLGQASNNTQAPNQDKFLNSVLITPAFLASSVATGEHMSAVGWKRRPINMNKSEGERIKNNKDVRYYFLAADVKREIPELIIDFKLYYTVPKKFLVNRIKDKIARIDQMNTQALSQNFAYYLSRVPLDEE